MLRISILVLFLSVCLPTISAGPKLQFQYSQGQDGKIKKALHIDLAPSNQNQKSAKPTQKLSFSKPIETQQMNYSEEIKKLRAQLKELKQKCGVNKELAKKQILQEFRKQGIRLGNRWVVREEGTGTYEALVFRDLASPVDRRYAMYNNRYVDL